MRERESMYKFLVTLSNGSTEQVLTNYKTHTVDNSALVFFEWQAIEDKGDLLGSEKMQKVVFAPGTWVKVESCKVSQ